MSNIRFDTLPVNTAIISKHSKKPHFSAFSPVTNISVSHSRVGTRQNYLSTRRNPKKSMLGRGKKKQTTNAMYEKVVQLVKVMFLIISVQRALAQIRISL